MLRCNGKDLKGKTVVVSGAGNVATYAIEKAWQLGAKPVTCSDSTGWIYDPDGIDVATLIDVKQVKRARLTEYAKARPKSVLSLNCVGLRKMLTTVASFSCTLRFTSDACPSCKAPIVGTKPTVVPF